MELSSGQWEIGVWSLKGGWIRAGDTALVVIRVWASFKTIGLDEVTKAKVQRRVDGLGKIPKAHEPLRISGRIWQKKKKNKEKQSVIVKETKESVVPWKPREKKVLGR